MPEATESTASNSANDYGKPNVKKMVSHLAVNLTSKSENDAKVKVIKEFFERGFSINDPDGARKWESQALQQAYWQASSRLKPLDFSLHGSGRPTYEERIVTLGISTVLDRGGYIRSFRDKGGNIQSLLGYGDGFMHIGTSDDEDPFPVQFTPVVNNNLFPDALATAIRAGDGRSSDKLCVIHSYSLAKVKSMFPDFADKIRAGKLPRKEETLEDSDRTAEQTIESKDLTEVAYWYDISEKGEEVYMIAAGAGAIVVDEKIGDDYPFKFKNGKAYIPVLQHICYPSMEGFYNHGMMEMIYRLAVITRQLLNMGVTHILNNVLPVEIVNIPKGSAASFFNDLAAAEEMKASGKRPYVPVEYDPEAPGSSQVSSQGLIVQGLIAEWQIILQRLDREMARLGVNLDETDRGSDVTASQIIAEEEARNAWAKQVMENNASETQIMVEIVMDMITEFVDDDDETPLNLTTKIYTDKGMEIPSDKVTLGMVAHALRNYNYFARVNSRSGAVPSRVFEMAQIQRVMATTTPGTPAFVKLQTRYASLLDRDLSMNDFAPQMNGTQASPEAPDAGAPVSDTDRIRVNPRAATAEPVI